MSSAAMSKNGCQSRFGRIRRLVAAQNTDQRMFALISQGKCRWSEVTWLSGQALAKSIGYQVPSLRSASQELKSQPKKALIVSVMSSSTERSSSPRKSVSSR